MADQRRFYEAQVSGARRSAPAALRNRGPIAQVLAEWLPAAGVVLEIASGTGEHSAYFAECFPERDWQPSDIHPDAIASIAAWQSELGLANLRTPVILDAADCDWPIDACDRGPGTAPGSFTEAIADRCGFSAVLCINMVHIAPWGAALGLLDGSAKRLRSGGALIVYGPWVVAGTATAPSNLQFDRQLRERDAEWGLRNLDEFTAEAVKRGFMLDEIRNMPANNVMLLFRLHPGPTGRTDGPSGQ